MGQKYFSDRSRTYILFLPNFMVGGAESFFIQLANDLKEEDFLVIVAVAKGVGELRAKLRPEVEIIDFNVSRVAFALFKLWKLLLNTKNPQLVTTMYHCNIIACIIRIFMPRLFLTIRESTSFDYYRKYASGIAFHVFVWLYRVFYRFADEVVFPSKAMQLVFQSFIRLPERQNQKVIPNYVNEADLLKKASEELDPAVWKRKSRMALINVGRLDKNKNQLLIIRALNHLKDLDVEFLHLGTGPELEFLKSEVIKNNLTDRVTFAGYQDNPFKFLKAADVFVLSSLVEGFPNVLVQAKFFGMHAIALNCPTGPSEILEDYSKGVLIDLNTPDLPLELSKKIRDLYLSAGYCDRIVSEV